MNQGLPGLEKVVEMAKQLPPRDKARLIEILAALIEGDLPATPVGARKSLFGMCSDLGPAPSAEEIDEARREEWAGFPREEI